MALQRNSIEKAWASLNVQDRRGPAHITRSFYFYLLILSMRVHLTLI